MKIITGFKVRRFILAAAFFAGLGFGSKVLADVSFLVDLNSKTETEIGTRDDIYDYAFDINDAGEVVGSSAPGGGWPHAFITGPNGTGVRDLGTLGGNDS